MSYERRSRVEIFEYKLSFEEDALEYLDNAYHEIIEILEYVGWFESFIFKIHLWFVVRELVACRERIRRLAFKISILSDIENLETQGE